MLMNGGTITTQLQVQSFEHVHLKLKAAIEKFAFYLTGKKPDSEDLAQEIFIKLWINWSKIEAMKTDDLMNYLFIIVRNHIIDEIKGQPKRSKCLNEYSKVYNGYYLHDDVLVSEGLKLHQRAVDQLAKRQRIVYKFHQNDYSAHEIAKMLNRSEHTVQNQLTTAYKKVKSYLNKNYGWGLHEAGRRNCWKPVSLN
jgi:RNA polymerase sigma factor (sigma-70 family)